MAAEVCVPGMTVHEIDAFDGRCHGEVDRHRLEGGRLRLRIGEGRPGLVGGHARFVPRRPPALDGKLGEHAQLARQVLNVGTGASVNLGRVFASQQCDFVRGHRNGTPVPLASTVALV